jgi:hypothetical protein
MSLINEALKRAQDGSHTPAARPATPPSRAPANPVAGGNHFAAKGALAVVVFVCVVGIGTAAFYAWRMAAPMNNIGGKIASATQPAEAIAPAVAPAGRVVSTEPLPGVVAAVPAAPAVAEHSTETTTATGSADVSAPGTGAAALPPPEPPKLILQGITSAGDSREAMINGVTVTEGEEIDGARVIAIESRRVRLEFAGRELVLRMP